MFQAFDDDLENGRVPVTSTEACWSSKKAKGSNKVGGGVGGGHVGMA